MNREYRRIRDTRYLDSKTLGLKVLIAYISLSTLWLIISELYLSTLSKLVFTIVIPSVIYAFFLLKLEQYDAIESLAIDMNFVDKSEYDSILNKYSELEGKVKSLSERDQLTGLLNRYSFAHEVDDFIESCKQSNDGFALIYIDIDKFNLINDSLGHACGDKLLKQLSYRLESLIGKTDRLGRLGGDEFILLLNSSSAEYTEEFSDKILNAIRQPISVNDKDIFITASIGISSFPKDGSEFLTLLKNSDTANIHSKNTGRDKYSVYTPDLKNKALKNAHMINQLRYALENEEFVLHYQPQVNMRTGKLHGVEALIRWIHPKAGFVPPMDFIPFAEETGFIYEIEKWVIAKAYRQRSLWAQKYDVDIFMSVNLSGKSIMDARTVKVISDVIKSDPESIDFFELEVTETAIMENLKIALSTLQGIKSLGIEIALDDFGTGYSSLTYLEKLPIDVLKIDQAFTNSISNDKENTKSDTEIIVKSVIALANDLNLRTVVEGLETAEQVDFFRENNCDIGQGYYFSRPLPSDELEKILIEARSFF